MPVLMILLSLFSLRVIADSTLIYEAQKKGLSLTEKDKVTLETGEISDTRYIIGGVLGTYPIGLGIGHAIQGRWSEKGWIFTSGELGSAAVFMIGALGCINNELDKGLNGKDDCHGINEAMIVTGVVGYIGFRIWEIVDVWSAPPAHNRKVRELKEYINKSPAKEVKTSLHLVPIMNQKTGNGLGLTLIF
jgi:hypothetical protein